MLTYSPLAGGWFSGRWRKDTDPPTPSPARQRLARPYDLTQPVNQRKLESARRSPSFAEEAGMSLLEMAIAFVINHPGVTSAIVGPRTMEQLESYLPAPDVAFDDEVLDRIDQIVAPGLTINPADSSFQNPALAPAAQRR